LAASLTILAQAPNPAPAPKKHLLAIGDVRSGYQHDSVSHALATIDRLGYESGIYVTYIRTDTQLLTKAKVERHDPRTPDLGAGINAKNIDYFDAIFFMGTGENDMSEQQKKDLLAFVHDDGKGFVAAHTETMRSLPGPSSAKWWGLFRQSPVGSVRRARDCGRPRFSRHEAVSAELHHSR